MAPRISFQPGPLSSVFVSLLFLCGSPLCGSAAATPASVSGGQPNILFILLDDLDATVTPFWEAMPRTRELILERGINFPESFAPMPVCCPSRAGSLTGKYAHNNGVYTNGGDYGGWEAFVQPIDENGERLLDIYGDPLDNEQFTFARFLQDAGYRTVLFGKYLNGIEHAKNHIPPGWSEWYGGVDDMLYAGYGYTLNEWSGEGPNRLVRYGLGNGDYETDVLRRKAIDFVRRAEMNDDQPFLIYLAPTAPHLPLPPARRHRELARQWQGKLPQPPNYFEEDLSDKAPWLRLSGPKRGSDAYRKWTQQDFVDRMGSLYAVDEMIEELLGVMEELGELEDTYVVFTSDNGYNNGSHRLVHKMAPYEESIRVPLVITGPGIERARDDSTMTLAIDLMPTFLEWAGVPIPSDVDGSSLVPLVAGEQVGEWHDDFVIQYKSAALLNGVGAELPSWFWYRTLAIDIPTYRALRTPTHTYIEWYDDEEWGGLHFRELYDRRNDPYQLRNMLAEPGGRVRHRDLVKCYSRRLEELVHCKGEECR